MGVETLFYTKAYHQVSLKVAEQIRAQEGQVSLQSLLAEALVYGGRKGVAPEQLYS